MLLPFALALWATGCSDGQDQQSTNAMLARGKSAIASHGCTACHTIPGIPNPGSQVGPPLGKIARRVYIAGVLANTPDNMVRWLRDPRAVDARTAMPDVGLSEAEAKDIAAYLATLD